MIARLVATAAVFAGLLAAQTLKDCRTVYLRAMPEALDEFIAVELMNWGALKVVSEETKADCVGSFGRQAARAAVRSSGSHLVPSETTVEAENIRPELPQAGHFIAGGKAAALTLTHRENSALVWATSKSDGWSLSRGSRSLARKLIEQMRKDLAAQR